PSLPPQLATLSLHDALPICAAQNAAIVTLTDFNRVRVQVAVPELETSLVATDQPVEMTVDGLPGRSFEGKITRFSYTLDEATKTDRKSTRLNSSHEWISYAV